MRLQHKCVRKIIFIEFAENLRRNPFAGLLPVMLSSGTGSEVMQRIAAPMVGGLASATVLTLVVIPAIYYVWKSRLIGAQEKEGEHHV
jgi:hypothetical protein